MNTDWLKDVRLHTDQVDWSDPSLTPAILTTKFCGPCRYLRNEPDDWSCVQREIAILKEAGWKKWDGESDYKPFYQHFLTLLKLLFPKRDITPNLADTVHLFCLGLANNCKALNLIGSQDSGKSSALSTIPFVCISINPKNSVSYVATPQDSAAKSTLWGDTVASFHQIQSSTPEVFPRGLEFASLKIELEPGNPKAGFIEYRGIKETGKYKGMKTVKTEDGDPILIVSVDEFNEVKSAQQNFTSQALPNLVSQEGLMVLTSQNFTEESNMGGVLACPVARFEGNPANYSQLDKELHDFWHSAYDGITLRFNGLKSPNVLAGRSIYPYLFKKEQEEFQRRTFGEDSPQYYSQVLSFPRTGLGEDTILARNRVDSSRWKDKEFKIEQEHGRFAHLDPSFGGKDKPVWAFAHTGIVQTVTASGGQSERQKMMWFSEGMKILKISLDATVNGEWIRRMKALGTNTDEFHVGIPLSPEHQLAIQAGELCKQCQVPLENFSYDFSMRAGMVTAIRDILGRKPVAFEYNGKPEEGSWIESQKANAEDICFDRTTELAMLTADLFLQRQIRGGEHIDAAVSQLCRTRRLMSGKKYKAEKKSDYKARFSAQSPDERDTLMGIVGIATKRGFRPRPQTNSGGVGNTVKKVINKFLTGARARKLPV